MTILWPPFVGWMFFCSLLFRILSRTRVIKEFDNIKPETFIQQARDFKMLDYDGMNKVVKFLSIADETHPWTVMRSAELLKWMDSGEYNRFVTQRQIR